MRNSLQHGHATIPMIAGDGAHVADHAVDLCARGLLTCTHGHPGEPGATYALAWLPLDESEKYSPAVRRRHARNMRRFARKGDAS